MTIASSEWCLLKQASKHFFQLKLFVSASCTVIILLWISVTTSSPEPWEKATFGKWYREICPR